MYAIYVRQSVDKKDSLSIEAQIRLCENAAGGEYIVYSDKGYSGKNTNRPDFERLMRDVKGGAVTKIYVYRLDRFSRSIADFGQVWSCLEEHNVQFESITEKFDTSTPMGRAMLNIIMTFAQLERETIAERVKDNYYHRFSLGSWPGGPAPIGFDIGHPADSAGRKVPMLCPNEKMEIVKSIFYEYAIAESSLGSVARRLNADGIEGVRRKTWDNVSISRILRSPLYVMADEDVYLYYKGKGLQISQGIEDFSGNFACNIIGKRNRSAGKYNDLENQRLSLTNHPGVIPSDIWMRCQYKLDGNRQLSRANVGKHSWLSGLMKCRTCGYSIKTNKIGDKFYLLCSGRSNISVCAESIRVDLRELEAAVESEMTRLLTECPPESFDTPESDLKEADRIDAKIERLLSALSESTDISMKYLNREIERLDKEKKRLISEQTTKKKRTGAKKLQRLTFSELSFDERKIAAAYFINKILLAGDSAEVIWKA